MIQAHTFVTFLWAGHDWPDGKKVPTYTAQHVQVLASMLARHGGHTLACVTDRPIPAAGVRRIAMPDAVAALPKYYPKVWAFSDDCGKQIGQRFTYIDLDAVVVGDLGPLTARNGDFICWNQARGEPYNTSFYTLEPGTRATVWEKFTTAAADHAELDWQRAGGRWTGDQSWVGHVLGSSELMYSEGDGLKQYRPTLHRLAKEPETLAYFLCGPYDPATEAERSAWIKASWQ